MKGRKGTKGPKKTPMKPTKGKGKAGGYTYAK